VPYVITDACIDVMDKSCVDECPVDCIYEGNRMLYIQPDECVECGRCEPVCPQISIFHDADLPETASVWAAVNAGFFSELGSPGGARKVSRIGSDHPAVSDARPVAGSDVASLAAEPAVTGPAEQTPPVAAAATATGARDHEADLVVVGAGPVGLYATYYAGFRGMRVAVLDSLPEVGGQITALYPEKLLYDVAGFPAVRGQDLVDALFAQASGAEPHWLLGRQAVDLLEDADGVTVTTDTGERVRARALLITAGIGTFEPRPLPAAAGYIGQGVRHFVPRLAELAGQDVVVVGGGDSAVDWALALEPVAASVTLVHRRTQFRAHARSVELLGASGVTVLTRYEVAELHGDPQLCEVVVDNDAGDRKTLPAQSVVAALGFVADLGPLEGWGLQLRHRHVLVDRTMRTNRPRVFAAGDVADHDGKVKLISIGFGEAALAVNHAAPLIDPTVSVVPGHSSDA
jgi:thioredoxin reductase/NAD-dependent dihydropyrimidine dehydrogenase PreA subunit